MFRSDTQNDQEMLPLTETSSNNNTNSQRAPTLFRLQVSGMSCTACSNYLEGKLRTVDGIQTCSVNFATGNADVVILAGAMSAPELVETVRGLGFGCEEGPGPEDDIEVTNDAMANRLALTSARDDYMRKLRIALPLSGMVTAIMMCSMKYDAFKENMEWCAALELVLTIPVVVYCGQSFFKNAVVSAQHATCTMDTLVALGVGVAMISSIYAAVFCWTHPKSRAMHEQVMTDMHFESASNLVAVMLLGRYLECRARSGTARSILQLLSLQPAMATVCVEEMEVTVATKSLCVGSVVVVRSGGRMPCDGVVVRGHGFVDESMVTGESSPVEKQPGDRAVCGTCALDGVLFVEVTAVGAGTSLNHIVRMVQNAQMSKPRIQQYADRIASRFVPGVISLALLCFSVWAILGTTNAYPTEWRGPYTSLAFALNFFVATVLISCPCALGLATPTAILVASGVGAQRGILVKGGDVLESCSHIRAVFFDKTGTLTDGKMAVTSCSELKPLAAADVAALAASSTHPASESVLRYLTTTKGITNATTREGVETFPGLGVRYGTHLLGSAALLEANGVSVPSDALVAGKSRVLYAVDGSLCAVFYLEDTLRPMAMSVVGELMARGVEVHIVSGDVRAAVEAIGAQLGIDPGKVHGEMLPSDKTALVQEYSQDAAANGAVLFVGDGINDAGALTAAHVGVAMATGADISIDCSDVVLTRSDLEDVITLMDLSAATMRRIRLNFAWALVYNFFALPAATGLIYPLIRVQVPPVIAGIAMLCSSLSVLTSSLLLRRFKPRKK